MRKATEQSFRTGTAQYNKIIQFESARQLAVEMLKDSNDWLGHVRQAVAATIIEVTYGKSPQYLKYRENVLKFQAFVDGITRAAMPGAHYVEMFPWMRYLPRG